MNRIKYIITFLLAVGILFSACKPKELDKPEYGNPPSADQLSFSIADGTDEFTFNITNTSSVTGIAHWDLGNGIKVTGNDVEAVYSFPGEYEITLTLITDGGYASVSQTLIQTETDYSLLTDPLYLAISGGIDDLDGKTWQIDSLSPQHLGIGQPDFYWPNWWSAAPEEKSGHYLYDDEFTFVMDGFGYTIDTKGATHCNFDGGAFDAGVAAGYYTSCIGLCADAYDRDASTDDAARGSLTWTITEANGKKYIVLSSQYGNIGYDGGLPRSYEVLDFNENFLHLRSSNSGAARYNKLIPKGYVRPTVNFDIDVASTANPNEYALSIQNLSNPGSVTLTDVNWSFGDVTLSDYETTDINEVVNVTYMVLGDYTVTATLTDSDGNTYANTTIINVPDNHPDYVPYIEANMSMYADFDEYFRNVKVDIADGNAFFNLLANPLVNLDNESEFAVRFTKQYAQWANLYIKLSDAYRFDLTQATKFKVKVYGNAGDIVLLKLENTDKGGNAWQTATYDVTYTIQQSNTWEVAEFDFAGVGAGWDWTGDIYTTDVTTDPNFNTGFYNVCRIMINPGDNSAEYSVILDDWTGPTVTGWKKK